MRVIGVFDPYRPSRDPRREMSAQLEEDAPRVGTPASQAAVEECYRAEHARLWRSLLLFSGDADLASDAVSEAFTQALHRGTAIRDLRRWVWRAAFAIARGELATRGRHAPELDEHLKGSETLEHAMPPARDTR
jgi:DNA-directed RNA polymerase specialized sigma24 family protein